MDETFGQSDALAPTRQTLLARLRDWEDQEGWREFFDIYWRLIYRVARNSDLGDAEARELFQLTLHLPLSENAQVSGPSAAGFIQIVAAGVVTRSRIQVYLRTEKAREKLRRDPLPGDAEGEGELEMQLDPAGDALDRVWQREWDANLLATAFQRLRSKVSSQQLLIFRLATLGELPVRQVAA